MVAHHVHHAHAGYGHFEQVGAHVHACSHEQAAVAAAFDGHELGGGEAFGDEVFGGGDEVVEHVELVHFCAGLVPGVAVFVASAEVGLGVDAAVFEPEDAVGVEAGVERYAESAVAVEVDGVFAVALDAFFVGDEHGYLGAVGRGVEYLFGDVVGGVEVVDAGGAVGCALA